MTEHPTHQSFLVRIYRVDPAARHRVTGVVEAIDGSGAKAPFTDAAGLAEALILLLAASADEAAPALGPNRR